ncbi:ATP-binding cassette domain-containing protein [Microbacterium sp. SSM24]|uniref:ATP-binding cassette domain-containing protein n=1 Tax=Microbacterium sp. SSM24 TaxID=2991714 RepID=UPI0022277B62|nr:ATP-binding cassette domain-containing protein [Microbacterium sp. SSM24]MCW3493452.1 ATP-binding cassette domain-containing protein [Microbacterium sp. SSM24]
MLEDVGFRYGPGADVLFSGISLEWNLGSFNAVEGPSGCGKSTLLDLLGGMRQPTSGRVVLRDHRDGASQVLDRRAASAWILQNNLVLSGRPVLDNVLIGATARGMKPSSARNAAVDAIEYLGLSSRLTSVVNDLSGGEQQRVTIARCLCSPSMLILADEPTGNLDAKNARLVTAGLKAASRAGKLVVVATHDGDVVEACDSSLSLRPSASRDG